MGLPGWVVDLSGEGGHVLFRAAGGEAGPLRVVVGLDCCAAGMLSVWSHGPSREKGTGAVRQVGGFRDGGLCGGRLFVCKMLVTEDPVSRTELGLLLVSV